MFAQEVQCMTSTGKVGTYSVLGFSRSAADLGLPPAKMDSNNNVFISKN